MRFSINSFKRLSSMGYEPIYHQIRRQIPRLTQCQWQRPALSGLLALTLCACASAPPAMDTAVAFKVPENWQDDSGVASGVASPLARWWLQFDDFLLGELIAQSLDANTGIKAAKAVLAQARALRDVASAGLWPTLGSSASAGRSRSDNQSSAHFQLGLDASWELDVLGANRSAVRAAQASADASNASLGAVQVSIAAEVALDYIALRHAQARMAIAQANLSSQQETLQLTRWRLQAGLVTDLEAEQANAAAQQTAAQIPVLQTTIEQTSHTLAVLTGQAPAALVRRLALPGPLPQAADTLAWALPADTLRQRSDVRAAEFQVFAAAARVTQARAARWPSFKLGGSLGLGALTLGALTDGASLAAAVLASVAWPVLDGGAGLAQQDAQMAALDHASATYQATLLTALTEVEDTLLALRSDRARLTSLQLAYRSAETAASLASQRYGSGLVDFQTVLETQRTRLSTQDSLASARAAVSIDHVRLYKALGGGWQPEITDSAIPAATNPLREPPS